LFDRWDDLFSYVGHYRRDDTLNYKNSLTINIDTIKDMVINNRDNVKNVRDDYKITRDHKRLLTVHQDKDYRIVFDNRVVMQDNSTRPYGFYEGRLPRM
jgi:hypothetical protein